MRHELLNPANVQQARNLLRLGLTLTLTLCGVTLVLNKLEEITHIDTPAHDEGDWLGAFLHLENYAKVLGFCILPMEECLPDELDSGGERWWLYEVEDAGPPVASAVDDNEKLVAV